jgi:hypothetical protein
VISNLNNQKRIEPRHGDPLDQVAVDQLLEPSNLHSVDWLVAITLLSVHDL